jgi:hypothetical protein
MVRAWLDEIVVVQQGDQAIRRCYSLLVREPTQGTSRDFSQVLAENLRRFRDLDRFAQHFEAIELFEEPLRDQAVIGTVAQRVVHSCAACLKISEAA